MSIEPGNKRRKIFQMDYGKTDCTDFCFRLSDGELWCSCVEVARRSAYFRDEFAKNDVPIPYKFEIMRGMCGDRAVTVVEFRSFLDSMFGVTSYLIEGRFYALAKMFKLDTLCGQLELDPFQKDVLDVSKFRHLAELIKSCDRPDTQRHIAHIMVSDGMVDDKWTKCMNGTSVMPYIVKELLMKVPPGMPSSLPPLKFVPFTAPAFNGFTSGSMFSSSSH